ncbi:MAG TPA: PQQ-binding-like beta-propeller repeat protein, partial [Polyangiaceae bacterium]
MKHFSSFGFLGVLLLGACGASNSNSGTGFATTWQNDNGKSIAVVERKLRALPLVPNARVAIGVTDTGLVAATLDGKSHWTHSPKSSSLPIIAGNLVIVSEANQIVALDATSGKRVWSIGNRGL